MASLTLVGKTPGQSQFGLDQFTEHYKTDTTADAVLTDGTVPQKGSAHPTYPFMFVTDRRVMETGPSASALDLVYQGILNTSSGLPVLPAKQHSESRNVASATTNTSAVIWPRVATNPATLQFYAATVTIAFIATSDAPTDEPGDPPLVVATDIITWNLGVAEQPANSIPGIIDFLLNDAFVQAISETTEANEVVAGQFWLITKRKIRALLPYAPPS